MDMDDKSPKTSGGATNHENLKLTGRIKRQHYCPDTRKLPQPQNHPGKSQEP